MKSELSVCHILSILVFIFKKNRDLLDTIIDFASFKVNFIAVRI